MMSPGELHTLLVVGDTALALGVAAAPGFFFLILMPGTGAELRASRKPVHSMAAAGTRHTEVRSREFNYSEDRVTQGLTLRGDDLDLDLFGRVGRGVEGFVLLLQVRRLRGTGAVGEDEETATDEAQIPPSGQ